LLGVCLRREKEEREKGFANPNVYDKPNLSPSGGAECPEQLGQGAGDFANDCLIWKEGAICCQDIEGATCFRWRRREPKPWFKPTIG